MQRFVLVEEWLRHLESKDRCGCTIENYRQKCVKCLRILEELGRPTDPRRITEGDMILLNRNLGLCEQSRRDYLKVLNYWIKWCTGRDVLTKADILWNRNRPVNRVFINEDKFSQLMAVSDEREQCILILGGAMGLRRDEIRSVRYEDITADGRLVIHGKGHGPDGKVSELKMPPLAVSAIEEWTKVRNPDGRPDLSGGTVIVSYQKAGLKKMSNSSVSHIVRQIGKRAGVRVTVHSLRRLFATSLYKADVHIADIKTLMRHASITTTINCYIEPFEERLDGIMDRMGVLLNIENDH